MNWAPCYGGWAEIMPKLSGQLTELPVADLVPHPRNYRGHPAHQIERIARSLEQHGQYRNVVVQAGTNRIIAGHGVVEAAKQAGAETILAMVLEVSDERAQQILIDDNALALHAEDNQEALLELLADLQGTAHQPAAYTDAEIEDLLRGVTEPRLEDPGAPEVQEEAITQPGDLWLLGKHRVLCGDSTVATDDRIAGPTPALLLTDPPYGLDRNLARARGRDWRIEGDDSSAGLLYGSLAALGAIPERYVWGQWNTWGNLLEALGIPDNCIVWVKSQMGMGHGYRHQHEFLAYWGSRSFPDQSDVWEASRSHEGLHPCMKPVELCARAIENSSAPGDTIFDPFLGSGTTLIAAQQTGRVCYGIEIEPRYVDVTIRRWQQMTGEHAILESTGEHFPG